jgi:hypothetical protein
MWPKPRLDQGTGSEWRHLKPQMGRLRLPLLVIAVSRRAPRTNVGLNGGPVTKHLNSSGKISGSLSRRDLLRAGGLLVPAVAVAPALFTRVAHAATTSGAFDCYISTSGSDSNAGTLASPWAITAINTKQSSYAGKRLGILPGTYDVSKLMGAYQAATLNINGGPNSSTPTYIGTANAGGTYEQGTATLDAKGSSGVYGGSNSNKSYVIGTTQGGGTSGPTPPNWGNWILDGINVTGFSLWAIVVGSNDSGGGQVPNATIQNCTLHDGNGANAGHSGVHVSPMELYCFNNLLVSNCYFYNYSCVGADSTHCQAMTVWGGGNGGGGTGLIVQQCTFVNAGGIYGIEDTGLLQNVTIQQCYFDMTTGSSSAIPNGLAIEGFGLSSATLGSVFRNNIIKGGGAIDLLGAADAWGATAAVYNNTWDLAGGAGWTSGLVGFRFLEASSRTGLFSCYNNLFYDSGQTAGGLSEYGYNMCNVDGFAVCDYNIYGTLNKFDTYGSRGSTSQTSQTFSSWQAATGADAHSITNSTNPFTNNGPNALQYQIKAGSPAYQAGRVRGVSSGAVCSAGAWDGTVTQIGYSSAGIVQPNPPVLTVS